MFISFVHLILSPAFKIFFPKKSFKIDGVSEMQSQSTGCFHSTVYCAPVRNFNIQLIIFVLDGIHFEFLFSSNALSILTLDVRSTVTVWFLIKKSGRKRDKNAKKMHAHQNSDLDVCDYVRAVSACQNKILSSNRHHHHHRCRRRHNLLLLPSFSSLFSLNSLLKSAN